MIIVAMNSEILTRFHQTRVVPPRFWFQIHRDVSVGYLLLVVLLFCCCSCNHQVDSCKSTCSMKRSHEQQQWYSTCLKRRTHTTVKLTHYSRLPSTRFCIINQVLVGMSGQNREPNTPVGGFDSKSKVVGEDCRPRTTVGHL